MLCRETGQTLTIRKVGRVDFLYCVKKKFISQPAAAEYTEKVVNQKLATERQEQIY